jgi:hypothetical protein
MIVTRGAASPAKTEFSVNVSDKLDPGEHHETLTFAQDKKVRVNVNVYDVPARFCVSGSATWGNGTLNGDLYIKKSQVQGPGSVDAPLPVCPIAVDGSKLPDGVKVVENPSQENNFTLHLRSDRPVSSFVIQWTKK